MSELYIKPAMNDPAKKKKKNLLPKYYRCFSYSCQKPWRNAELILTLSCILMKNGQMCYQNFALRTPQEFQSIF